VFFFVVVVVIVVVLVVVVVVARLQKIETRPSVLCLTCKEYNVLATYISKPACHFADEMIDCRCHATQEKILLYISPALMQLN
jgi:hypothetical protein